MGGALDSARFKYRLAEALDAPISDVDGMVIGGHSDKGMVPLIEKATRNSVSVSEFLDADRMQKIVEDTKVGGATLTHLAHEMIETAHLVVVGGQVLAGHFGIEPEVIIVIQVGDQFMLIFDVPQATENFEQTLHSLSAAVHLLTARTRPQAA